MKKLILLIIVFFGSFFCNSLKAGTNGFNPEGYFTNPISTRYGIVASNDLHTTLYLIHGGKAEELLSAPGCGRYFTVDKNGSKIGFKLIDASTGLQTPAIYDIAQRQIIKLTEAAENAGQVSFADDGTIAYTIGSQLYTRKDEDIRRYDLGVYCNRAPISPDAAKVIFRDDQDQLYIFDLKTSSSYKITDNKMGYCNAVWSPDAGLLAFTSNGMDVFTYNVSKKNTYSIGQGENPQWAPDSRSIVYFRREIDFNKSVLINSDIYVAAYDGSNVKNISNTPGINEMDAAFDAISNNIIYHTYSSGEIRELSLNNSLQKAQPGSSDLLYKLSAPLNNKTFEIKNSQAKLSKAASTTQAMQWIHVHQVWDTRDNGSWKSGNRGYDACGATTAIELLASYGILKPWPFTTYSHNSDYGLYDSDAYTFNGYTFNYFSGWPSGAHGYMWTDGGSPYSHIVQYLSFHGVNNATKLDGPSWSSMAQEINAGNPFIFCSTGLTAAHIVLVYAQYGNTHTVVADDPYGDKNVGSYGQINNGGNAIYDWSDGNTGHQLITPAAWGVAVRYTPTALPNVASNVPSSSTDSVSVFNPVAVTFSHQMDIPSTEKAFSISPSTAGTFAWSNYNLTMTFKPEKPFIKQTRYIVRIDTSAKSFWNKPLAGEASFSFVTKSRDRLNVQVYPQKDQQDISTTVQFRIVYDGKVTSYNGALFFTDSKGVSVSPANIKLKSLSNNSTMLSFEPKYPLAFSTGYRITLPGTFADAEGTSLRDTIVVNFTTQAESKPDGNIVDAFENSGLWNNPSYSGSTTGVDTAVSKFTIASDRKRNGQASGKLAYSFTQNDSGVCRVFNASKPSVGADNNSFGIWVFGDLSYNTLEYWFYDMLGDNKVIRIDTLNWTGWKFKETAVSKIPGEGAKRFHSIVIRQNIKGSQNGEIYFDDMQTSSVTSVDNGTGNMLPSVYSLSQNYPNPFNPSTTINYSIAKQSVVKLGIYNSLGENIAELVDKMQDEGSYSVRFDAVNIPSGIYFCRLEAGSFSATKKLMFIK